MNVDVVPLLVMNIILGSILLYSYYHYIQNGGVSDKSLWGNMYPYRKYVGFHMIIAALGYIMVLVYSVCCVTNTNVIRDLMITQLIIVAISMVWMPLSISYIKSGYKNYFIAIGVVITLLIVALASFNQILILNTNSPKTKNNTTHILYRLALFGSLVFCFHTGVIDLIGWNIGFFVK